MLMNRFTLSISLSLCLTTAHGDTIADFDFTNDGNSFDSSAVVAGVSVSDLTNGIGMPAPATNNAQGNPAPSLQFSFGDVEANLAASVAADDYYSFTVTPAPAASVTYNQFNFDFWKTSGAGANVQAVLFSSVDGFSVGDELGFGQLSGNGAESGTWLPRSVSLGTLPTDITTPVEFRLVIHDAGATNQNNQFRIDNIEVDATVIPEPASALLMLLGTGLLLRLRRRS